MDSYYPSDLISIKVMVIGAWFQNKPQYRLKPFGKFGDKVAEREFISAVRIICDEFIDLSELCDSDANYRNVKFKLKSIIHH